MGIGFRVECIEVDCQLYFQAVAPHVRARCPKCEAYHRGHVIRAAAKKAQEAKDRSEKRKARRLEKVKQDNERRRQSIIDREAMMEERAKYLNEHLRSPI